MTADNIVVNIMMAIASICLLFMAVIFNTKLLSLFKDFKRNPEKAFVIAAFVICDIRCGMHKNIGFFHRKTNRKLTKLWKKK